MTNYSREMLKGQKYIKENQFRVIIKDSVDFLIFENLR